MKHTFNHVEFNSVNGRVPLRALRKILSQENGIILTDGESASKILKIVNSQYVCTLNADHCLILLYQKDRWIAIKQKRVKFSQLCNQEYFFAENDVPYILSSRWHTQRQLCIKVSNTAYRQINFNIGLHHSEVQVVEDGIVERCIPDLAFYLNKFKHYVHSCVSELTRPVGFDDWCKKLSIDI